MSWWLALIIAYLAVSYITGLGIIALYSLGFSAISHGGKLGFLKATSPEEVKSVRHYALGIIIYWILSPIYVPWWLLAFAKMNGEN